MTGSGQRDDRSGTTGACRLDLDDYEVANLKAGLVFLASVGGDTGDWFHQILSRLPETETKPNKSAQEQKRDLAGIVGWRLLWTSR